MMIKVCEISLGEIGMFDPAFQTDSRAVEDFTLAAS